MASHPTKTEQPRLRDQATSSRGQEEAHRCCNRPGRRFRRFILLTRRRPLNLQNNRTKRLMRLVRLDA